MMPGWRSTMVPTCCTSPIMVVAKLIREYRPFSYCPGLSRRQGPPPVMFDGGVRSATDAVIALALGATAVGIGRSYAYALSYGGAESLTHYLKSFLAELDLCLAICGFKDIASLKEAGCEQALTFR